MLFHPSVVLKCGFPVLLRWNIQITRRNSEVLAIFGSDKSQMMAKLKDLSAALFDSDQAVMRKAKDKSNPEDEDTENEEENI